jgi:protein-tyrosine phosphatase
MKILMVCLGNICRSPLAEGILQAKIQQHQLDWEVDSAGTGNWHHGDQPDERSIRIAKKRGIDISEQRARPIERSDFERFDLILAMDTSNYANILNLTFSPEEKAKVKLMLDYVYPGENRSVPDPYWDDNGFAKVFDMLEEAVEKFLEQTLGKGE